MICSILPSTEVPSLDYLSSILNKNSKLHAFNRYCASDLTVIGTIQDGEVSSFGKKVENAKAKLKLTKTKKT